LTQADLHYEVQHSAPNASRDNLLRVWKNLEVKGELADKFRWTYEQAPYLPDTVFLLKVHDRVVGSVGYGVRTFCVGGESKRVAVMADLAVDSEHRSLAPALALVKAGREHVQKEFDFAYGWPNHKAEGVFARARYKSLGTLHRYVRVLRYEAYLDRTHYYTARLKQLGRLPARLATVLTRRPVAAVGTRVFSQAQRLRHFTSTVVEQRVYSLQWSKLEDERLDQIWDTARGQYPIVAERTSRFLRWRFAADNVRVAVLTRKSDGSPCAYAVLRVERGDAQLVDVFGEPNALAALLALLVADLWHDRSIHVLSCLYLGRPGFVEALLRNGFEKKPDKVRSVFVCGGRLPEAHRSELEAASNWHLTALDEDV
jgi:hypothetical protein